MQRLEFLDIMKGLIMFLLAAESCQVYASLYNYPLTGVGSTVIGQFYHHPWHGLNAWDLVQPSFMLIAGTALYLSYAKRASKGISWAQNFKQVLVRSVRLFLLGIFVLSVQSGRIVWELYNVLTQLSFTLLLSYLIINRSILFQLLVSALLLIITECCYRYAIPDLSHDPFVIHENFGSRVDAIISKKNVDGWVTFNCIPTAAHTIWGVCAGKLLRSGIENKKCIRILLIAGVAGLLTGYGMDWMGISPIIKRICTSSFILASGGWVFLIMAIIYWMVDVKGWNGLRRLFLPFAMNAIFIYVFFETVGYQWLNPVVKIFIGDPLSWIHVPDNIILVIAAIGSLAAEWYLCYWLYKRKIFFKA
jgi:predicted acyltransferase